MKTHKENTVGYWLNKLREPYRTQALENSTEEKLTQSAWDAQSAILYAFHWNETKEGAQYWCAAHKNPPLEPEKPEEPLASSNARQIEYMNVCKWYLGEKLGRSPTDLELIEMWVDGGFAEKFRNGEMDPQKEKSE